MSAGYVGIVFWEDGLKCLNELFSLGIDVVGIACHLFFQDSVECFFYGCFHLEQCVALFERIVVGHETLQVGLVVLRDDSVHEASSLLASFGNEFAVIRRNKHQWQESDVIGEFFVVFFVALELFFLFSLDAAVDVFGLFVSGVLPLNQHEVGIVADVL